MCSVSSVGSGTRSASAETRGAARGAVAELGSVTESCHALVRTLGISGRRSGCQLVVRRLVRKSPESRACELPSRVDRPSDANGHAARVPGRRRRRDAAVKMCARSISSSSGTWSPFLGGRGSQRMGGRSGRAFKRAPTGISGSRIGATRSPGPIPTSRGSTVGSTASEKSLSVRSTCKRGRPRLRLKPRASARSPIASSIISSRANSSSFPRTSAIVPHAPRVSNGSSSSSFSSRPVRRTLGNRTLRACQELGFHRATWRDACKIPELSPESLTARAVRAHKTRRRAIRLDGHPLPTKGVGPGSHQARNLSCVDP